MTSKSFRRSRQSQKNRKSRRGGNTALANAVSASVLPVGLTLWQQRMKRQNGKKNFQKTMRNLRRFSPVN